MSKEPNIVENDQYFSGYSILEPAAKTLPKRKKLIEKIIITKNFKNFIYFFSLIAITVLALLEAVIIGVDIETGSGLVLSILGSNGSMIRK